MKKKILCAFFILSLIMTVCSATAFAKQKTEFPVDMKQGYGSVRLKAFDVVDVHKSDYYTNKIKFDIEYSDSGLGDSYMVFNCYNDEGKLTKTVSYQSWSRYINVPSDTAMIEVTMEEPEKNSDSYIYKLVKMYASDGRTQYVGKKEVEENEKVGWKKGVTMYAPGNGEISKTNSVSPYKISEYEAVGWYTYPVTKMYALDGRSKVVATSRIKEEKAVGWYSGKPVKVYALDGRTKYIGENDVAANEKVGWKKEVTMYALGNGDTFRTLKISPYEISAYEAVGWYEGKPVKMYALDGRTIYVAQKEVSAYEKVGWYKYPVMTVYALDGRSKVIAVSKKEAEKAVGWYEYPSTKLYALDGRSKVVATSQVNAEKAVGWYTLDEYNYYKLKNFADKCKAAGDYNSIFAEVEKTIPLLTGTKYELEPYNIRSDAMNSWRNFCGRPMGVIKYSVGENSIGTPEVTIHFRNISYKKIIAYKVKFTCYNVFGELEESYYDYYYDDSANIDVAKTSYTTWTLHGADSVKTVKNIRVTEVVYEDGTKWYGN